MVVLCVFAMPAIAAVGDDIFTNNTTSNSGMCEISVMGDSSDSTYVTEAVFTPIQYTCAAGTYLPADALECATCPGNSYCGGGTYEYNETTASGINPCPTGYTYNTTTGKSAITQCQIQCSAGTYLQTLPTGYTQLEYIESNGTQYILTNIPWTSVARFRGKAQENPMPDNNIYNRAVLGSSLSNEYVALYGTFYVSGTSTKYWYWNTGIDPNITAEFDHHKNGSSSNWTGTINGVSTSTTEAAFSGDVILFGSGSQDGHMTLYRSFYGKVWYIQLFGDNGNEIFNGIPARRNSDNVLGMYDTVSGNFFTNAGTGDFIAGNVAGALCSNADAGYYSAGGVVNFGSTLSQTACPNDYPNSVAGSSAQNQCYAACTTANVPHSTAVIGNNYYGDGVDTCAPADSNSCDGGYHYVAATENSLAQCVGNTITLNWGGNDNDQPQQTTCTYGTGITTPTTAPTKRGHTFIGWRFVAPSND